MEKRSFKELLKASYKSEDTEEWLDVHFTRPIGIAFALMWEKLGVHPNAITILSIILGVGAGMMFYFPDLEHNIYGDRTQELPVVTSTEVTDIKKSTYSYDDIVDDNCYVINVAITYKKDLGYPTEVTVKLVHNGDKLEAFYMK